MKEVQNLSDLQLLKEDKINELFKKYMPLIESSSRKHYYFMKKDTSISYEDILQKNMILTWSEIKRIQKKIKEQKVTREIPFGVFLKNKFSGYNRARIQKKKDRMYRDSIFSLEESIENKEGKLTEYKEILVGSYNFESSFEITFLFEKYINTLTQKERDFVYFLIQNNSSCTKVHKATGISMQVCNSLKKKLKKDFIIFLTKEGYKMDGKEN